MATVPVFVEVASRRAVVVGLTEEMLVKIARLAGAGAEVEVFARPSDPPPLVERARALGATVHERTPEDADFEHAWLVFAAPGDDAESARLFAWARAARRLVCTLDRPELSTFVNAAVVEAGGLTIAISSGGASPGLVRKLREGLERILSDERLPQFVESLRELRASVPRGERAQRGAEAVLGFELEGRLVFPDEGRGPRGGDGGN